MTPEQIPPSLLNMYKELMEDPDVDFKKPSHGCLIKWAEQVHAHGRLVVRLYIRSALLPQGIYNLHRSVHVYASSVRVCVCVLVCVDVRTVGLPTRIIAMLSVSSWRLRAPTVWALVSGECMCMF
jgi:hypothetical protein